MRILFAGTPALAVPCLERIARAHDVAGVLTVRDQPAGRGRAPVASPVKEKALSLGLRLFQPERLDADFLDEVCVLAPDLLVVAAYGKIFRQVFLDIFPLGGINVHPSLLPRHRGPSPISAALLAGDPETGITIQRIALKFDTGGILAQMRHALVGEETTATLTDTLAGKGAGLLASVLDEIAAGRPPLPIAQREEEATYCHPLRKEDGVVRWEEPADIIERKIRAFDPWPRAATIHSGETLLLLKSHVYPDTLPKESTGKAPGTVLAADNEHGLLVGTGRGVLAVERLQLQFKKPLDWRPFLNGHPEIVGTRLGA
jgi:methionyl-tRNA formyltransferase